MLPLVGEGLTAPQTDTSPSTGPDTGEIAGRAIASGSSPVPILVIEEPATEGTSTFVCATVGVGSP